MITLLADVNIEGHVAHLVKRMQAKNWIDYWELLELEYVTFAQKGLKPNDSDSVVWHFCQQHQLLLLTGNRNDDDEDSLEATIRRDNMSSSLPVFTIGDPDRVLANRKYADRVVDRLFRYLLEIDNIRGTGRLYLP